MALVSAGGRTNGRWKPENQDAFLLHDLLLPAAPLGDGGGATLGFASTDCGKEEEEEEECSTLAAAAVVGVFDGHGMQGRAAARLVRDAVAAALEEGPPGTGEGAALSSHPGCSCASLDVEDCASAAGAALLHRCFERAEGAVQGSSADLTRSGATAVVCLLQADRWACCVHTRMGVCVWWLARLLR